jgi:hypothetical protein
VLTDDDRLLRRTTGRFYDLVLHSQTLLNAPLRGLPKRDCSLEKTTTVSSRNDRTFRCLLIKERNDALGNQRREFALSATFTHRHDTSKELDGNRLKLADGEKKNELRVRQAYTGQSTSGFGNHDADRTTQIRSILRDHLLAIGIRVRRIGGRVALGVCVHRE